MHMVPCSLKFLEALFERWSVGSLWAKHGRGSNDFSVLVGSKKCKTPCNFTWSVYYCSCWPNKNLSFSNIP